MNGKIIITGATGGIGAAVTRSLAARVLCLPLYAGLMADETDRICDIVLTAARS